MGRTLCSERADSVSDTVYCVLTKPSFSNLPHRCLVRRAALKVVRKGSAYSLVWNMSRTFSDSASSIGSTKHEQQMVHEASKKISKQKQELLHTFQSSQPVFCMGPWRCVNLIDYQYRAGLPQFGWLSEASRQPTGTWGSRDCKTMAALTWNLLFTVFNMISEGRSSVHLS